MAGIYIHIPFCKSRCIYCGFYSTTAHRLKQRYVDAVCREMEKTLPAPPCLGRETEKVETVYLGGGTPSQLSIEQLQQLFLYINKVYDVSPNAEVTIEVNPDDVTEEFAVLLSQLPVNRVSMGVQTFDDQRLQFLHRRHTAQQIPIAVERLRKAGINNISIDLMYGFPNETLEEWHQDIDTALQLDVEHLSAYALMYEEGTKLFQLLQSGLVKELDEEVSLQMYSDLIDRLKAASYEHYEISNFAKPGVRSRHNSNYWNQTPYIGLGAAAHSYNGEDCRRWHVDDVLQYIEGIENGSAKYEEEFLDEDTRYNDLVMTALRTCEGLNLNKLTVEQAIYCKQQALRFIEDDLLHIQDNHLRLTRKGLFVSNMIMSELMRV